MNLQKAILAGRRDEVKEIVQKAIDNGEELAALLNQAMIPAMREIGERYARNEVYVPELFIAARAMQTGLTLIEPLLAASEKVSAGKIAVGTVKGDLHDIGKNLLVIMLKGAGYEVIDLGVNCDCEKYNEGYKQGAYIIACSSLLTTTMLYMKEIVNYFADKDVKVIIGGAPVNEKFCQEIGADGFAVDASAAIKLVDKLFAERE
jgi:5-methyltetrahydrofolate--homocysteine methyltransferase